MLLQALADEKYDIVLASNVDRLGEQLTAHLFDFIPLVQQEIVAVVPNDHPRYKKIRYTLKT